MTHAKGLSRIPLPVLEELESAVDRGRLPCPLTETELAELGVRHQAADVVACLGGLSREAVLAGLRVALAERVHRPPPRLSLVWTGPETRATTARSTAMVVEDLFESAQSSVLVGGYAFDRPQILEPLHRAMRDRGVSVTMFVDIPGATRERDKADAFASEVLTNWLRKVWVFGPPWPEIYYDPRTAVADERGHDWATLHAKCIVVDDSQAFITSANFTDRGQTRNLEVGVRIEDKGFAEELSGQFRRLIGEGLVRRYRG